MQEQAPTEPALPIFEFGFQFVEIIDLMPSMAQFADKKNNLIFFEEPPKAVFTQAKNDLSIGWLYFCYLASAQVTLPISSRNGSRNDSPSAHAQ